MIAMQVKPEEDPRKPATPVPAPAGYKPICASSSAAIRQKFGSFEQRVIQIQCNLKKNPATIDNFKEYDEWLHAFASQPDGQGFSRKAWYRPILEWKLVKINGEYARTPVFGKRKKGWLNEPRVCRLMTARERRYYSCSPDISRDDQWGNHEDTKNLYLDRSERSEEMRKTKKRGNLQLLFSKPSYPEPFLRSNAEESLRPMTTKQVIVRALKSNAVAGIDWLKPNPPKVQAANDGVYGPPRPEETNEKVQMEYSGKYALDETVDWIERMSLMKEIGHCNKALSVPLAYKRRFAIADYMHIKYPGYPAEAVYRQIHAWEDTIACREYVQFLAAPRYTSAMNARELWKCTLKVDDDARYKLYWRQKYAPREQDPFVDVFITNAPLNKVFSWGGVVRAILDAPYLAFCGASKEECWQFSKMMCRQKKWSRHHHRPVEPNRSTELCLKTRSDDKNIADTRLRMFWNQYVRGEINAKELEAAKSKLGSLSRLLEERKRLPVAIGSSYGDFSREEKILMVRFNMGYKEIQRYENMRKAADIEPVENIPEVDYSSADVMADHVVCRLLGDGKDSIIKGEYIPKENTPIILPDSATWNDKMFPNHARLPSGIWVPKHLMDWRNYKEVAVAIPEIAVKSDEGLETPTSKFEARVRHPGSRFRR